MGIPKELQLQQFEQINQALFYHHPDAFYLLDLEGRLIIVNEVVCLISGFPREVLIGQSYESLIHPDSLDFTNDRFKLCLQDIPQRYETAIISPEGTKYLDVTNFPYKVDDRIIAVFGIAKDITAAKEKEHELIRNAELLKAKNDELDIVRKIIAHDLRRPVANAIGFAKLLEANKLPETKVQEIKSLLRRSVESVDAIVRDLNEVIALTLKGEEVKEKVWLESTVKKQTEFFINEIRESSAAITISIAPDITILTIKAYLQSILRNLISNALKYYVKDKVPIICISAKTSEKMLQLSIKDNGIGMDLARVNNDLFKMHKRFAPSMAEGNGLGLYIVNKQVKLLGGTIEVYSEPGQGSEFIINLPLY